MIWLHTKIVLRCAGFASLCPGLALMAVLMGAAVTAGAQAKLQITPGAIVTVAGGFGHCPGQTDALGDGCPAATNANLQTSWDVKADASGNVYIADYNQSVVRKVDENGTITTFAGGGSGCSYETNAIGDGCPASSAILNGPAGLAVDANGNVYITEFGYVGNITPRVRIVSPNGTISTFAGTGVQGYSGDGGLATSATMEEPTGVATDASGNVYIVDLAAAVVRMVDGNFHIHTIVGGGSGCSGQTDALGDGCPATSASLLAPFGITVDSAGNIYIADTNNNRIRKVSTANIITTVAGTGTQGFSGDNGPATAANLNIPERVIADSAGNLYIADNFNSRIRKVNTSGTITTIAGGGTGCTFSPCSAREVIGNDGSGNPLGLALDPSGNLYFGSGDFVQKIGPQGAVAFPATTVGQSSAQTIVLSNLGVSTDVLQGFSSVLSGNTADFAFTGGTCISNNLIAAGSSCTLQATFTPTVSGQRSATATFSDTAAGSPHTITLYGQGNALQAQTITFPAIANHIYGDAPFALTATASSGLPVTYSVVSGPATISGSTLSITGVGSVTVQANQAGNGTYSPAAAVQQTFTVAKAVLTVTANSLSRVQGQPNPPLTYTMTGFVLNDTQATATTGQPALSTTAVQASVPGTYPITITAGTLAAVNYSFMFVNSSLVIVAPGPTTTTLALSAGTVTTKQVVTLTATVLNGDIPAVGTVTFVDSSTGQPIGTVQLVGSFPASGFTSGTATLKRGFAAGQHLLQANFNGTSSLAKSSSSQQGLTVTGTQPSVTTLTAQPNGSNPANTDLTATVFGFGTPAPTGTVNFNDITAGTSLGSVAPAAGTTSFRIQQFASGTATGQVAMGDFNGDGIQDLVMTDHGVIDVLIGKGDGTFAAPVTYPAGTNGQFLAVGDFNATGVLDIAMGDYSTGSIVVLAGNGDGTFQPQQSYPIPAPSDPFGIVVADVNGDGLPDLVVAQNNGQSLVTVLLNNGDFGFQPAQNFGTGGSQGVVVGDFNGDGIPDIAATTGPSVAVLLGKGDGTFQPQLSSAATGQSLTAGDFNGDGKLDIALASSASVLVALGKGDGTFSPATSYPVSVTATSIATADFNGDGHLDLVASGAFVGSSGTSVLLGNGNGTFQTPQVYNVGGALQGFAVGDVNGDGTPDIVTVDGHAQQFAVLLGGSLDTTTLANVGVVGTGAHTISATYSGDSIYAGSVSNNVTVNANLLAQTITFSAIPSHVYGNAPFALVATATSNLPVTFSLVSGPATVTGNTLTILGAGAVTVQANQAGNASYAAATPVQQTFAVAKAILTLTAGSASISQGQAIPTLTYTPAGFVNGDLPSVLTGAPSITTTATPSSPVGSYPVVITNGTLSAANYSFLFVYGVLAITQGGQTITFAAIPNHVYGDASFALAATASSGLPVSFSIVSGPAAVAGSTLTILGSGVVTVQANQAGNATYTAAPPVQQTFAVAKAVLTLTAGNPSIAQGQGIPTLTFTAAGFVNGDPPSVLTGAPSIATTATASSPAGSYPIVITTGTLSAANYSFQFVNGVLTITSASFISGISPQEIAAGANGLKLTVNGGNLGPYTVVLANGAALPSTYVGSTQITATVPPSLLAKPGVVQIQVQVGNYTSPATPLTVVPGLVVTSLTPALAIAQSSDTPVTASGLNFTSTSVLQFNGAALRTTFVSATQLQTVIPAANLATAQTAQITALDPASGSQSAAVAFSILPNPAVVFTGPPTASPGTQPSLNFQLSQPYPIALSGTMTLTFQPSQGEPDDPAIQFASGGRTFTFALPANSSTTPTVQLQAGTVAGTITVTLTLTANGVNVTPSNIAPVIITVPKSIPVITKQSIVRNGSTVTINITGYSSSRDMANAYFNFTAAPGASFTQSSFTVPVGPLFSTWFSSTPSNQYGSTFTYFQTFTLDSKATDVGSVTVTLENAQGKSQTEVVQ